MSNIAEICNKLYEYIRVAEDKKLHAIYNLLVNEIEATPEWWRNKEIIKEFDSRYNALEDSSDKGFTPEQILQSIGKLRKRRYGK